MTDLYAADDRPAGGARALLGLLLASALLSPLVHPAPARWLLALACAGGILLLVHRMRAAVHRSHQRFRHGFHDTSVGAAILSPEGRFLDVNDALSRMLDQPRSALLRRTAASITYGDDVTALLIALERARREHTPQRLHTRCLRPGDRPVTMAVDASWIDDGREGYFIAHAQDISEQVADFLTGLPNREIALDHLAHALDQCGSREVAVIVVDLDDFKVVNDSLGHLAGDEVLNLIAPRLSGALRPSDTIARIGGDQFLAICDGVDGPDGATRLAEQLAAAVAEPLELSSGTHHMTASIGIAVGSADDSTPDGLVRDAVATMHRAKARGRGRRELFDEGLRRQVLTRMRMETDLRAALDREEIEVHYQPVVDACSGRMLAIEALARWTHPEHGPISPAEFIPVAEATGLITDLGRLVLETTCRQVAHWQRAYPQVPPVEIYVNVSGRELSDPGYAARVADVVIESGLAPGTLGLEITESVLMEEAEAPVTVLSELRAYGLRLSLDDFGTGYSSLSYLKRFPLDALKIDRSFVAGLGSDADDEAIVGAIVSLARTLGLTTVAEGVETEAQRIELERLGCPRAQGYRFAAPLSADAFEDRVLRAATAPVASAASSTTSASPSRTSRPPSASTASS